MERREYPIRVVCVFSTLDRGGAESMCMNLLRHIDRNRVQFDFIKHTPKIGTFEDEIRHLGGKIYEAPRYKIYNHISYTRWWKRFLKIHPEHIIIHGYFFTISSVFLQVAKKAGRITIGHIHASAVDSIIGRILVKRINKSVLYPLACSQQAGHWVYGDRPFTVLNNGLDTETFHFNPETRIRMRRTLGMGGDFTLGTVANLSAVKNPMGLIEIFLTIKKVRHDVKLIWIGEGNQRKTIEERIKQEHIEDSVTLLGARNDVPDLLQAMDAFLLPSYNEGLPLSAIEAQAAGLPCYISNRVTKEVDITGLCKFLPIDKPELWADAILHEAAIREDTSAKIKAAGYDINDTAMWLQNFYLDIAKRGK